MRLPFDKASSSSKADSSGNATVTFPPPGNGLYVAVQFITLNVASRVGATGSIKRNGLPVGSITPAGTFGSFLFSAGDELTVDISGLVLNDPVQALLYGVVSDEIPTEMLTGVFATPRFTDSRIFGDASDGIVVETANRTLTRDVQATKYTSGAFTITPAGFRILATESITVSLGGIIDANGQDGLGSYQPGQDGGRGGKGGRGGYYNNVPGLPGQSGGLGGKGGDSTDYTLGGTVFGPPPQRVITDLSILTQSILGGGGGGGGGGNSVANSYGGGGGGGGGVIVLSAPLITIIGTVRARGGKGGVGGNGLSGGNGGGGVIMLIYRARTIGGTLDVSVQSTPAYAGDPGSIIEVLVP